MLVNMQDPRQTKDMHQALQVLQGLLCFEVKTRLVFRFGVDAKVFNPGNSQDLRPPEEPRKHEASA